MGSKEWYSKLEKTNRTRGQRKTSKPTNQTKPNQDPMEVVELFSTKKDKGVQLKQIIKQIQQDQSQQSGLQTN